MYATGGARFWSDDLNFKASLAMPNSKLTPDNGTRMTWVLFFGVTLGVI
jgi:hypothetical protein